MLPLSEPDPNRNL